MDKAIQERLTKLSEGELSNIALKITKVVANNDHADNSISIKNASKIWVIEERRPRMIDFAEDTKVVITGARFGKRDRLILQGKATQLGKHVPESIEIACKRGYEVFESEIDRLFARTDGRTMDNFIGQMIMSLNEDEEIAQAQAQNKIEKQAQERTKRHPQWGAYA